MSMGDSAESLYIDSELTVVQEAAQLITEDVDLDQSIRRILRLWSHPHGLNRGPGRDQSRIERAGRYQGIDIHAPTTTRRDRPDLIDQ